MKVIRLLKKAGVLMFLLLLSAGSLLATPTFNADLRNDYLVSANVYEFDLYLLNTTAGCAEEFQLANVQFGINVPATFRNGGTISVSMVPGTSELLPAQQPTANKFSFQNTRNVIIMTAMANPGVGNGTIISCTSPGTRVARVRLTNTVSFGLTCPMGLTWCFSATTCGYPTKVSAYVGGLATDISASGTFTTSYLCNPCINKVVDVYNVTGTGSYCQGGNGLAVGLSGSELGVTYTMDPGSVVLAGTGGALNFGIYPAGVYTVSAARNCTYITGSMTGSAVITMINTPGPAGPITGSATAQEGSTGNAYSVALIPDATTYVWSVTGGNATINGQGTNNVTLDFPLGQCNLTVQLHVFGQNQCGNGIDSFFDIFLECAGSAPSPFDVTGGGAYCAGGPGLPVGLAGSETGVTYELYKNTVATGTTLPGDGNPLSFGNQLFGTYTVKGTNSFGSTWMTGSAVITETPLPVAGISASGPLAFCEGGSVDLTATGGTTGSTYLWHPTLETTATITVNTTGSYYVTVTTDGCSDDSDPVDVTVYPYPVAGIQAGGPTTFCAGGSVELLATGGVAGSTYLWSPGGETTEIITVTTSGSYTVAVTTNGCTDVSDPVDVTVNPYPVASIQASGPLTFCAGGSVDLTAVYSKELATYLWHPNGEITSTITVNASGTYWVTVTVLGCSDDSDPVTVTVNPYPVAGITANGPTTFCDGGSVELTATGGVAGSTYLWSPGGETTESIIVTAGGSYSVAVTTNGCTDVSDQVVVTVNPNLTLTNDISAQTVNCPDQQVTVNCNHNYPVAYCEWYLNGSLVYTGMNLTFTPSNGDQVYCVCYVDLMYYPCWTAPTATSNTLTFTTPPSLLTWTGAVDNNWHNAANWNPAFIPECCTDVTIPAGLTFYPTLSVAGTCGDIFIDMGATLVDNGFLTVCGTADVKRCYTQGTADWHLIGSPINNGLSGLFAGRYLQSFTAPNTWTDITSLTQPLNVMEGYAMWCPGSCPSCVDFVGNLNLGNLSKNVNPSWNLLSNPFVASVDWNLVNLQGVYPTVWYLDAFSGNYLVWNVVTGGTGSQYVPPTQGFFVEGVPTAAGSVGLTNAAKSHMNGTLYYKSEDPSIVIIEANGQNYKDQTWVRFNEQENAAFDGQTDVRKIISISNPKLPQIYTTIGNDKMTINSMPQATTVPMGFTAIESGTFTINAPQTGYCTKVTLEDLFNGTMTDLRTSSYTFTYTAGDQEGRFLLHFNGVGVDNNQADLVNIYSSEKTAYVAIPANRIGDVKIMNMLGQEVKTGKLTNVLTKFNLSETGIYVVQATVNGKVYTQKVIIR